ncbi:MAG TPA: LamG-like jellyroll fold domain-containing protein [Methylomirabilota bacterium]|nr:LamG-like jellyroll fold domain-containing protein [Methylomirabilota bacterium]
METKTQVLRRLTMLAAALLATGASWAQSDVTQPADPIIASSSNSPGSEGVANAIDGKTTKYLNFDSRTANFKPSGFVVSPSAGLTRVTGMTIQAANDAPERDPKIVTLEGSNDAAITNYASGTWEAITTITTAPFATRFSTQTFSFENKKPYKHYRWVATETATPNTCCMQVAEVELLGTVVPGDITQPGDPVFASSSNSPGSEGVANAIDDKTTKYLNFDSRTANFKPSGFVVSPAAGRTLVTGLTLQAANDAPERDPKTVTLEGSNDAATNYTDGTWTMITTISNIPPFATRFSKQTFLFDNHTPYRSYRWVATETQTPNTCCMQIAEVELLGTGAPTDITQPGDKIVASSSNSPGSEGVANAIDNKTTKYLNFDSRTANFKPSGFVVTPAVEGEVVIGMTIQAANDAPERDPKVVRLEGSNDTNEVTSFDSGTWEQIATITTAPFATRFSSQEFYFPNAKTYRHYRWTALETATPNTCCMQVAEVELLAVTASAPPNARFVSQPTDTPVLAGQSATFFTEVNGPWPLQWYVNGVKIAGATGKSYTTATVDAVNTTNIYTVEIVGREMSQPVRAVVFTPSATRSIGIQFEGGGANGAPTPMLKTDIAGVHPQAYWNVGAAQTGDLPDFNVDPALPLLDSSNQESTITVNWATGAEWGSGTGVETPTQRMLNGIIGNGGVNADNPGTLTFSNVPDGAHSVLIYAVSPPLQFQTVRYKITGTTEQTTFARVMNSDEYNAAPGFYRAVSTTQAGATIANFIRFDNVRPANGVIMLEVATVAGSGQASGMNAIQLVLNAVSPGAPPVITADPQPTVAAIGGTARLSVTATGQNLTYQWRKNGRNLSNGGGVSGATTANLVISDFNENSPGVYSVAVFNPAGSTVSGNASVRLSTFNITQDLGVYLALNETSGTTAANTATGGRPGTVVGTPSWGAGRIGGSFGFDGGTYLIVTNYTKARNEFGLSGWFNVDPSVTTPVAFARNAEGNLTVGFETAGQFELGLVADATSGALHLQATVVAGPNFVTLRAPEPFTLGSWQHVAVSADGAQMRLYVNGAQVASTDYSGAINTPAVQSLTLGARVARNADSGQLELDADPQALIGRIDDFALWGRALTADEVNKIRTAGNAGQAVTTVVPTPPAADPTIRIASANGAITITFDGGVLQSSATASGPYENVAGATSPYTVNANERMRFFRVRR